jgi:hypothetical protein
MKTAAGYGKDVQLQVTFGELTSYNAALHEGKFNLPAHPDPTTGALMEVGPLQLGTIGTGPGYGVQFVPAVGAQALIIYVDLGRMYPVAAVFLYNNVEHPPFPDGAANGWKDSAGQVVKTVTSGSGHMAVLSPDIQLGSESLDSHLDAVLTVRHFQDWVNSTYVPHHHSGVKGGPDTSGPPTGGGGSPEGSSVVKASP